MEVQFDVPAQHPALGSQDQGGVEKVGAGLEVPAAGILH
jgi:hypothetical protein